MKHQSEMTFIEKHRRAQIIDTAIKIISRDGYHQATLASVAREAGFSKGVIFYYFKNKDELTSQINNILLEELTEYTGKRLRENSSPKENLKMYVNAYFEFIVNNRDKFAILMELGVNLSQKDEGNLFSSLVYRDCRKSLAAIMDRDGMRNKMKDKTAEALVVVIQAMLDGVGLQFVSDPGVVDMDECRRVILGMINSSGLQ